MPLVLAVGPAVEPLSLSEIKAQLRIDTGNQEPAPDALTAALISPADPGNVDDGAHRYLATFVTADGETQGGAVTAPVTVADKTTNGKVSLTAIPVGGATVTARKIYRTVAGGSTYLLLATIADNTTTVYTDNTADSGLGAGAPTTNTTDDPLLSRLARTVRRTAEVELGRKLITQQWKLLLDAFPGFGPFPVAWGYDPAYGFVPSRYTHAGTDLITLPWPTQTVDSVKYYDTSGVQQTLVAGTDYEVDTASLMPRVVPAYGASWPATNRQLNAVEITFTAGFGLAAAVPEDIKSWMLLMVEHYHENRGAMVDTPTLKTLPFIDGLLDEHRIKVF